MDAGVKVQLGSRSHFHPGCDIMLSSVQRRKNPTGITQCAWCETFRSRAIRAKASQDPGSLAVHGSFKFSSFLLPIELRIEFSYKKSLFALRSSLGAALRLENEVKQDVVDPNHKQDHAWNAPRYNGDI